MSKSLHAIILDYIHVHETMPGSDEQILRRLFANYRTGCGLRLTQYGQHWMQSCFHAYVFENTEGHLQPSRLIYLDKRAKMPYFCDDRTIIIYDPLFAVQLKLADGCLSTLMEIDTD